MCTAAAQQEHRKHQQTTTFIHTALQLCRPTQWRAPWLLSELLDRNLSLPPPENPTVVSPPNLQRSRMTGSGVGPEWKTAGVTPAVRVFRKCGPRTLQLALRGGLAAVDLG